MMPKYKLRGEIIKRWKAAGCPQWDYDTTKNVCLEVNRYPEGIGQNRLLDFVRRSIRKIKPI